MPELRIASAWGMVRGKPSNRQPLRQSGWPSFSFTRPTMMSSETRLPLSITFFAARPSGVPALAAARSISPVAICGMPKRRLMNSACVPFPAPGGPRSMSLMACPGSRAGGAVQATVYDRLGQTRRGFVPGQRRVVSQRDRDRVAVPQRAQLLERLEALERRLGELRVDAQELDSIRVHADVSMARQAFGNPRGRGGEGVPRPRHRGASEVARETGVVEHHLHHVGIEQLARVADG